VVVIGTIFRCDCLAQRKIKMLQDWERIVDTQGFPPSWTTPNRMSFWEEKKAKKQIDALVHYLEDET
jgi:hypothetical protein